MYERQQEADEWIRIKIAAIVHILEDARPDVVVLQEVNDLDQQLVDDVARAVNAKGYFFHWGPQMETGSSMYTGQKRGKQSEYYPIIFRVGIECNGADFAQLPTENRQPTHTMALRRRSQPQQDESEWLFHRPLVVYRLWAEGEEFLLAVIHTSPGREDKTSPAAVSVVKELAGYRRWIIAGDWYLQPEENVTIQQGRFSWYDALGILEATRVAPPNLTNYSHNTGFSGDGGSKVADYFVCRQGINGEARIVLPPRVLLGKTSNVRFQDESGKGWFTAGLSDHVPVVATLVW